ncbi:MAG: cyclic-phosphate processing receiver domain-containing protein [Dongiaceae bacterium]
MKLFVDDIRNAPDDTWHVARTALEAIRAIARYDFEVISLDHDISHQIGMGELSRPFPCPETFASVAYYIVAKYLPYLKGDEKWNVPPKVILHTSNEVAGDEMAMLLGQAGIMVEKKYMGAANRLEMEV